MVVVGVDGSEESRAALRWAVEEARLRQTPLRAVYAWLSPVVNRRGYIPPDLLDLKVLEGKAQQVIAAAVDEVAGGSPGVEIEPLAVEGPAAQVLLDTSQEAELLVVGSRGHGGFTGLLLGSVGQQCAHHAPCPVVVVRRADTSAAVLGKNVQ